MNRYLALTISAKIARAIISPALQPLIPAIAAALAVSSTTAKYSWVILTFSYVCAQLFLMIWGDRYTVKRIIACVLPVSFTGALICMFDNIYVIQAGIFCIGFGCGVTATLGNVLLKEVNPEKAKQSIAITSLTGALAPILALVTVGNLIDYVNWHYVFVIIFSFNLITWLICIILKSVPRNIPTKRLSIITQTKTLVTNPRYITLIWFFISYATISGIIYIVLPFLAIKHFNVPYHIYAYALIPSYVTSSIGSFLCLKLSRKITHGKYISIGLFFCYLGLIVFFLFNFYHFSVFYIITFATCAYFLGLGMFSPFVNATIVLLMKDDMCSYSISFFTLVGMSIESIIMIVATHISDHNSLQFAYLTLALLLSSTLGAIFFARKNKKDKINTDYSHIHENRFF